MVDRGRSRRRVRFGQSESSWKTQRMPSLCARRHRVVVLHVAADRRCGRGRARACPASTCISVDLPAPLWPTRPTHSPAATRKSTPSSARTAPKCFSTPSSSTMVARAPGVTRHDSSAGRPMDAARAAAAHFFMLALIAAMASSCVYSWLATPPFSMFGSAASKSSWVKAR